MARPPKQRPLLLSMRLYKLAHLVNGTDTVQVAIALRVPPREQAMPPQDDAVGVGIGLNRAIQHQSQLKPGTLPRNPHDIALELLVELFQLPFPVGARRQSNRPIRMQVVHMLPRKKCMQRGVDRSSHTILAKRRERIESDHLVFVSLALVKALELL